MITPGTKYPTAYRLSSHPTGAPINPLDNNSPHSLGLYGYSEAGAILVAYFTARRANTIVRLDKLTGLRRCRYFHPDPTDTDLVYMRETIVALTAAKAEG